MSDLKSQQTQKRESIKAQIEEYKKSTQEKEDQIRLKKLEIERATESSEQVLKGMKEQWQETNKIRQGVDAEYADIKQQLDKVNEEYPKKIEDKKA